MATRKNTRAAKMRSVRTPKPQHKPALSPEAMAPRLETRKPATGLGGSVVEDLREARDGVPARALRAIRARLEIASAVAYVCAAALREQATEIDTEVALSLQRCVGDEVDRQTESIDRLLGEPPRDDLEEDCP
jgi:hypothetical protein